jgi:hypothetical protein
MSISADWAADLWRDSCDVYRPTTNADGDPAGWEIVSAGNPCFFHGTPNYDEQRGPISLKQDSVMTTDTLSASIAVDIQSRDKVKVTLRNALGIAWVKIQGAPKVRALLPKKTWMVTVDTPLLDEEIVS